MEAINFVYWLQGFLELTDAKAINEQQAKMIKDHIALVLTKQTPIRFDIPGAASGALGTAAIGIIGTGSGPTSYC